ncbi:hypothetical protein HKD37_06G016607 [Glycine soja]
MWVQIAIRPTWAFQILPPEGGCFWRKQPGSPGRAGKMMGTNQNGKRLYQVKIKSLDVTSLKELGRLMEPLQRQAFRKVYGKILDLTAVEVFTEAVVSLAQYYDQPLRCFTFGDFQMVPTVEEFEEILGCPLRGRKLYLFSGFLPSLSKIAAVVGDSAKELDRMKQTQNGVVGLPRKYLEGKARDMASQEKWVPFVDILALLIFGVALFLNVDGLVDLAAIDAFLAYHHSKESPVVAISADLFDTFDRRCEKNSARIICCLPALCVWLVSHLFQQDIRHPCPLQSYRSCIEKRRVDWDQHLAGIGGSAINWFPRWKEGKEGVLFSCGDYPNVPLMGTRGCINYNPALAIRQLGYPMRGAPTEESLSPSLVRDFGAQSLKVIQRVHKVWRSPLRKDKELRGIRNCVIGGYHGWLRVHTLALQALKLELGKARLAKEKFKSAATNIRKEYTELREENAATARALEQETKRAHKEEHGRDKFRGALSKRSLAQHLEATEQSMLAIIGQYKEELNQSVTHEQKLVEDFTQVYAEKEARGRVIDALHQEATMWMDRFALTLNGSQDLPRLLAKAKAIAEVCTAPEEIHGLINYCQHMIDLMAHIIRNLKIKGLDVTSLKELGRLMEPLQRQAFRKVYRKILDLTTTEVFTEAIVSLAQYYDQPLRCFTFGDFQIISTVEEFEEILGCPLGGRKLYLFSGFLPSLSKIAAVVRDSARELDRVKQTRNGVVGLPRKYLEGKARDMASQEEWVPFADILALLIFGVVLFPSVDGLVDLAAIDAFLAYHHSKESPVVAILVDLFNTFDRRCEKNSARIVYCLPTICVWLVLYLFQQDIRHPCPLQSYRSCVEKRRFDWDQYLAWIGGSIINWFPLWKEGKEGVLFSCGDYPNVPLIGTRGCINYNPALAIRQLGYPMRGAQTEESLSPFLVRDFGAQSLRIVQRVHKAWESPGIRNDIIGGYHEWLRVHTRGLDWLSKLKIINEENFEAPKEDEEVQALKSELRKARLAKEKFKSAATSIRKECAELREENAATAKALQQETKRARKEGMILKEELAVCPRSKRSLAQHLEATERSMLAIIGQYKEELNQSLTHEQKLVEDFAQAYTEKEARGRVIDALHQEATMWMDRFALTLNGTKAIAEVCSAPEEIHRLINYCQHMIDLMAHIIRNHLVFAGERIESGLRKGKFEYASNVAPNNNRRAPVVGTRKKEGDTHAVTTGPTWIKVPQNAQNSYQHNHPNFSIRARSFLPTQVEGPPAAEKMPAQHTAPATPRPANNTTLGTSYNNARCPPKDKFSPIPMAYSELWPSLLENNLVVAISGKVFQPPYPNIRCNTYADWLSFQEEGPNVKTSPLASHGGASVNAIEKDKSSGSKRLKDVATTGRFIYQSLQAACMVSRGGGESDECLFHLEESHNMETCPAVEELLQRLMECGEEPQICMQSEERKVPPTPKALVICFTRNVTGSRPKYPPTVPKPTPFSNKSNKAGFLSVVIVSSQFFKRREHGFEASVLTLVLNHVQFGQNRLRPRSEVETKSKAETNRGKTTTRLARLGEQPLYENVKKGEGEHFLHPKVPPPPPLSKNAKLTGLAVFAPPSHLWLHFAFIFDTPTHSNTNKNVYVNKTLQMCVAFPCQLKFPNVCPHRKWLRESFPQRDLRRTPWLKGPVLLPSLTAIVLGALSTSSVSRPSKDDFQEEIARRRWTLLVTPMAKFDLDVVLEFYANAWPTEEGVRDMRPWVRGQWIPFDADALSQFLGDSLVLEEGQECEYSQRRNQADGFDEEAIAQLLCKPGMPPTRHPLDSDKSNRALGFPALITGLCQSFGVPVTPSKVIRPPITRAFIEKYCMPRQAQAMVEALCLEDNHYWTYKHMHYLLVPLSLVRHFFIGIRFVNGEGSTPKDTLYRILDELRSLKLVEKISQDEREKTREEERKKIMKEMKRENHVSYSSHDSCKCLSEEVSDYYRGRHRSHTRHHSQRRKKDRRPQEVNISLLDFHGKDNVEAYLDWEMKQQLKRKPSSKSYGFHSYPRKDQAQGLLGAAPSKPKEVKGKTIEKSTPKTSSQARTSNIKCFKCLGRGHIVSQCPTRKTMIMKVQDFIVVKRRLLLPLPLLEVIPQVKELLDEGLVRKSLTPCALLMPKIGIMRHRIPMICGMMNVLSGATLFCKIIHASNIFMIHIHRNSLDRFVLILSFNTNLGTHMGHLRFVVLFGGNNQHENIEKYKEIWGFHDLTNFSKRFVSYFSILVAPLIELVRNHVPSREDAQERGVEGRSQKFEEPLDLREGMMQSYSPRALDRRLPEDWDRDAREGPRVLMNLRAHLGPPEDSSRRRMGTNQTGKRFYQVKVKSPDTTSIKELGRLMEPLQMQAFRKTYGKILELTIAEVSIEAIASLTQYYDQPLRCFTFGDFQLVPTIEEFEEILGCPLGGRKPYLSSGCLPSLSRIATMVKDSARGLDRIKQTRNGIAGLPQKYLEDKARGMANQGEWVPFMDVLALLIFGVVLFPNVDGLVGLAAIDAFLAYHHSKESPVVAVLADLFDTFDRRCEKSSARIICCLPALCVWLVSHLFQQDTRHPCPLLSHRSCTEKRRMDWDQLLAGIGGRTISWFPRWKEGKEGVLFSCGRYPNIPLVGTRGCINYNPTLAIRQLGYPMRGAPTEESMSPFLVRDLGAQNSKTIQRIHKAWETPLRKDQELRGVRNGIIGGYHEWLKVHIRADMSALKEQMASMMEAMLSMKQLIEKNAATAAAVSSAAEADPTPLATTHHPPSNIVGRGRDALGHDGSPHLGYNRAAYPYGLPPNYSPPIMQEDAGHIASPVHEKEPPQQPDEVHKDPQDYARRDVEFYPPIPEGLAPGTLPQPNIAASPILVGYMPSSFADLVFAGERIEVGLKRGKFDYVSSTNVNAKRIGATGAKRKEGDAHAVSSTPAWVKPQQTPHGTHQYAQHHPSFSAHAGNASSSTPVQPKAPTQREAPQVPTPNTPRPAGNSNTTRNFPPRPLPEFTPLPMTYEDLLPSLIANHLAVVTPGRVLEPPFPKWYDPNATCKYHGGAPGHSIEKCLALKYKVQHLMDAGWLTFQEDRPNVRTNPLANHGGGAVNAVESDRPHRSKPLRDVATPRRFIFEALQKGGVIPHSGCKEDSCLLHPGEMHDMETCLEVEELLQRMIDQGRLEVGIKGKEEQHICMQSTEGSGVAKPKPLVIYFTKSAASQKPGHPLMAKPVPFPYQNSHAVPWRYTPPGKKEEEVTDVSSLSAKVTNITGLSVMLGNGYEPGMGLGKDNGGITSLIKTQGNRGKYGLGYKPTQADMKRSTAGRKDSGQSSRWRQESEGSPPCHISRSFISAGLGDEGQVFAICEDDVPSMAPTRHPLDPDKSNRALGFPALITGLCQSFGVPVAPTKVIRPPITRAFIEKYSCLHFSGENTETFPSLTSYPELRRSEFLIGGYVGARASLLSTIPPFVAMTQELVARGDTLRLSAPLCHSDTVVSDGTQRPSLVILHT